MKKHLTIENGKRVMGQLRVSAPRRKDGRLGCRLTLTTIIEDDELGDVVFSGPMQSEHDRVIKVRKGESSALKALDIVATMPGLVGKVDVWPVLDGAAGTRATPEGGLEGALLKVRVTAGNRHTKQVAIIDVWASAGADLGGLLDAHDTDVQVKVRPVQTEMFGGTSDDEDDLPDEASDEVDDEQLALDRAPAEPPAKKKGKRIEIFAEDLSGLRTGAPVDVELEQ